MTDVVNKELKLACGIVLNNRLVKAATTEGLADEYGRATRELANLYRTYADESALGMIITGNLQVDRRLVERPGNLCIDLDFGEQTEEQLTRLRNVAEAARSKGAHFLAQLSHAGRQSSDLVVKQVVGPSAIETMNKLPVKALTEGEIKHIIEKFVYAAKICEQTGFSGVQVQSAHGYLLSSFLNPLANVREDAYGGSLENRASVLLEIIQRIKAECKPDFAVCVKLNSSDFQKGGFTVADASAVAVLLAESGIDLLELSGGNYEKPAMAGTETKKKNSTERREAYFLDFSKDIAQKLKDANQVLPLMVTGGFRSVSGMASAIESGGTDLIGIGRPLCMQPSCTKKLLAGEIESLPKVEKWNLSWGLGTKFFQQFKLMRTVRMGSAQMVLYNNLIAMGEGKFKEQTETKHPSLISGLTSRLKAEKKKASEMKGLKKGDPFVVDKLAKY